MAKKEKSYKQSIEELEDILNRIESGDQDVDELAAAIKRASELIKSCKEKLYKADKNIQKILDDIE